MHNTNAASWPRPTGMWYMLPVLFYFSSSARLSINCPVLKMRACGILIVVFCMSKCIASSQEYDPGSKRGSSGPDWSSRFREYHIAMKYGI
jgi:hypothetical protein